MKAGTWRNDLLLWPSGTPYSEDSLDGLLAFLRGVTWTYNEAENACQQLPSLPHIEFMATTWYTTRATGTPCIWEKSRRLIASWVATACELWSMGLRKESRIICGLNYPKAAEHVWRHWFIYNEIRKRNPLWGLKPMQTYGSLPRGQLDAVVLPNGSTVAKLNQEGESFQGSGYTGVRMEEFSLYSNPAYMYGQAMIVTQGSANSIGGHVVVVTNASPNQEWQDIKK